jgi:pyrimidine operon attenuation protein/uracil phosphoribosyltransferase
VTQPSERLRTLLDAAGVARCLDAIAGAIHERWANEPRLALVGVYQRGVPFARALLERLRARGLEPDFGRIDITQYRDDLQTMTVLPKLEGSDISFDLDDAVVILCDEVIHTARTTRAALEELLGFGRPRCVQIAALIDRDGRELPLYPRYTGLQAELPAEERVCVRFADGDGIDEVFTCPWDKHTA